MTHWQYGHAHATNPELQCLGKRRRKKALRSMYLKHSDVKSRLMQSATSTSTLEAFVQKCSRLTRVFPIQCFCFDSEPPCTGTRPRATRPAPNKSRVEYSQPLSLHCLLWHQVPSSLFISRAHKYTPHTATHPLSPSQAHTNAFAAIGRFSSVLQLSSFFMRENPFQSLLFLSNHSRPFLEVLPWSRGGNRRFSTCTWPNGV